MTRDKVLQAVEDGILEKIKDLAKMEATNEITEDPAVAESQFAVGLRIAKDAFDRCTREAATIFDA